MAPHHNILRAGRIGLSLRAPLSLAVVASNRMHSSPACQVSKSLEVVKVRSIAPVSGFKFAEIAVRWLSWIGAGLSGRTDGVGRGVFMPSIKKFCPLEVIPNGSQLLGTPMKGTPQGAIHE